MKDTVGLSLRETWKQKGKSECLHPELSTEHSFAGVVTGACICTTCCHLMSMDRVQHEGKPITHSARPGQGPGQMPIE